jgi:HAD superfamily hydrolase (TIGR01458 family)
MPVRGLLLDLEGVLYEGSRTIADATDTVRALRHTGLILRFLTNTTTRARRAIAARLVDMGIDAVAAHVFSPAIAAQTYLAGQNLHRLSLACPEALREDFAEFEIDDDDPQAVILGDLYKGFDWDLLNRVFRQLAAGARLVALHKNRYTRREVEGLALDLGPFVAALEYATEQDAVVVGKPSPTFFEMALRDMGLGSAETMMVGDDIDADIGGARDAGIRTVQVRTGKYRAGDEARTDIRPDHRIDAIGDLPALLTGIG